MPIYVVEIDGKTYDIEGDRPPSEAEAREAVRAYGGVQMPANATAGMLPQSTMQEKAPGILSHPLMKRILGEEDVIDPKTGMKVDVLGDPGLIAGAATSGVNLIGAAKKIPGVLGGVKELGKRAMGVSTARAGANMQAAAEAAKAVPVSAEAAGQAGLRALDLGNAGATLPKAVRSFMQRATDPKGAPLSFREASDFVSNFSRMSGDELAKMTPAMRRQVAEMAAGLRQALTEAAGSVGKGEQYAQGVSEYAKAAQWAKRWEETIKPLLMQMGRRGAEGAGMAGAGTMAYQLLKD